MPSSSDNRTRTPAARVGVPSQTPTYGKECESALDAHIRDTPGLSFDRVALAANIDGETLRLMCEPSDRRQLGASRLGRLMRATNSVEWFNNYMRLPGHEVGGVPHQLVPCPRASTGDLLTDTAAAARECTTALEALIELMADGVDPLEAVTLLRLYRPLSERVLGAVAQPEAIARRES